MSTLVYASIPRARKLSSAGASAAAVAPSETVSAFVESVTALVPAEILAAHAAILNLTTETTEATGDVAAVTTITEPSVLSWAFWGLVGLSILLYVVPLCISLHKEEKKWQWQDTLRMLIPPAAFVVWTMLQKTTAFDAVCPSLTEVPRGVIALFAAITLALFATWLSYKTPESGHPATHTAAKTGAGSS